MNYINTLLTTKAPIHALPKLTPFLFLLGNPYFGEFAT